MNGGDPRDVWASTRTAPPEWLFYLILVLLLGGAGLVSLYLSQRWRNRREETVLGGVRRKQSGFLSPQPGCGACSDLPGPTPLSCPFPHQPCGLDHAGQGRAHLLPPSGLEAAVGVHPETLRGQHT